MEETNGRREFLRRGAAGAMSLAVGARSMAEEREPALPGLPPVDPVRVGFVGVGGRGTALLGILLGLEGVEVRAVCDLLEDRVARAQEMAVAAGRERPTGYSRGETDFERLCGTEDVDLVINAVRPWKWHVPISVAAMKAGKHAATEVPAAETIEGCWQLVETAETTGKLCVMLENVCYFRNAMLVHHMLRRGLFGDIRHCEAGYQHYLPPRPGATSQARGDKVHTANSYPTHPIGPVAQWMDINRGNRFDYLVSMSADGSRGNSDADINTSLIRTANGQTITLYYDTRLPRPYDLIFRVQGTRGIYSATLERIYLEGRSPQREAWEPMDGYYVEFEHPLWKQLGEKALAAGGHGGADWLMLHRLIRALRKGTAPDMDVHDAAAWSAITELSERSVARRSGSVDFPDFTRGRWRTTPPIGILEG